MSRHHARRTAAAAAVGALLSVVTACGTPAAAPTAASPTTVSPTAVPAPAAPGPAPTEPAPTGTPVPPPAAPPGTALALLDTLPVKGRAPRTGYDRDRFGRGWVDTDRNGCDSRNDVLRRDLRAVDLRPGTRDCVVLRGTLDDPFSGATIAFTRGESTSDDVQVDHVVALSNAWQTGAQSWDEAKRTAFANDPLELLAVDGRLNQQKGDGDAATWLPPNRGFRCAYVARQVAVKAGYGLWVTAPEREAMARVLAGCPEEPAPAAGALVVPAVAPGPPRDTVRAAPTAPAPGTDPRFPTCKAAEAAGLGPYAAGSDPEFDWYRDADADGLVCE